MRSRIPYTGPDGQCTAYLALFMVTAPPTSLTAKCNRVYSYLADWADLLSVLWQCLKCLYTHPIN